MNKILCILLAILMHVPAYGQIVTTLDNGMRVYIVKNNTEKFISAKLMIHKGFASDTKAGIAHLVEHLAFQNTEKYSYEYMKKLFAGGSDITMNATTTRTATQYDAFSVSNQKNIDDTLSILSQILFHIKPTQQGIEKEKRIVQQERKLRNVSLKNVKEENHWRSSMGLGGIPVETDSSLQSIDMLDIKLYLDKNYKANNATLILVSDIDEKALLKKIKYYFSNNKKSKFNPQIERPIASKGLVNGYVDEKETINYLKIKFALPYKYDWASYMALTQAIDFTLNDLKNRKGKKLGLVEAWTLTQEKSYQNHIYIYLQFDNLTKGDAIMRQTSSVMRDMINTGITEEKFLEIKRSYTLDDAVKFPVRDSLYNDSVLLNVLADQTLGDSHEQAEIKNANSLNQHLQYVLNHKWYSWETTQSFSDKAKSWVKIFVDTLKKPHNAYTLIVPKRKKDLVLKSVKKNKSIPVKSEVKIADKIWKWTLQNGIDVYFYSGINKTKISAVKKNTTGYNPDTLRLMLAQLDTVALQGMDAGVVQNFASDKMGRIDLNAVSNFIEIVGFSHGLKDSDLFSMIYSYLTEDIALNTTKIEPIKKTKKNIFDDKWLQAQKDAMPIYQTVTLNETQTTQLYKDYIQNADGYTFIITSSSAKADIKSYVEKTISHLKNYTVSNKNLPFENIVNFKDDTFTYSGTGRENTAIQYVKKYKMPYTFKSDVLASLWAFSIRKLGIIELREEKQSTYYVNAQSSLSNNGVVAIATEIETNPELVQKNLDVLNEIYKKALYKLSSSIGEFKKHTAQYFVRGGYEKDGIVQNKLKKLILFNQPYTSVKDDVAYILNLNKEQAKKDLLKYSKSIQTLISIYQE